VLADREGGDRRALGAPAHEGLDVGAKPGELRPGVRAAGARKADIGRREGRDAMQQDVEPLVFGRSRRWTSADQRRKDVPKSRD